MKMSPNCPRRTALEEEDASGFEAVLKMTCLNVNYSKVYVPTEYSK